MSRIPTLVTSLVRTLLNMTTTPPDKEPVLRLYLQVDGLPRAAMYVVCCVQESPDHTRLLRTETRTESSPIFDDFIELRGVAAGKDGPTVLRSPTILAFKVIVGEVVVAQLTTSSKELRSHGHGQSRKAEGAMLALPLTAPDGAGGAVPRGAMIHFNIHAGYLRSQPSAAEAAGTSTSPVAEQQNAEQREEARREEGQRKEAELCAALRNFELFYNLPRGSASAPEVRGSSAGIKGWATANLECEQGGDGGTRQAMEEAEEEEDDEEEEVDDDIMKGEDDGMGTEEQAAEDDWVIIDGIAEDVDVS